MIRDDLRNGYESTNIYDGIYQKRKEVELNLLDKMFDQDFLDIQRENWQSVKSTVIKSEDFDYYVGILRQVISEIRR